MAVHRVNQSLTFAMVAGEASGDILGAGLIEAVRERLPYARFVGIGGPKMEAVGFESWFPMERLAVMGIVEVLKRLPELLELRKELARQILVAQPAVFIGIDAPDFNLFLEKKLRDARIRTLHYVSPSVWAWRRGRIKTIRRAVDKVLTLFPFEADLYRQEGVSAEFVGHPLADQIPLDDQKQIIRERLGLNQEKIFLGVLPGSRTGEIKYLAPVFIKTMLWLKEQLGQISFLIPMISAEKADLFRAYLQEIPGASNLDAIIKIDATHDLMAASDVLLMASGTATLEGLLFKKPMVVAYKWHPITHMLISPFVKTPYFALPNILSQKRVVPEFLQNDVNVMSLGEEVLKLLPPADTSSMIQLFNEIHTQLRVGASHSAADAVLSICPAY